LDDDQLIRNTVSDNYYCVKHVLCCHDIGRPHVADANVGGSSEYVEKAVAKSRHIIFPVRGLDKEAGNLSL